MPGADDRHGQRIAGKDRAADEEQAGRIVDSREQRRIAVASLEDDVDRVLEAERDHVVGRAIGGERRDQFGKLRADPADRSKFVGLRGEDTGRRAELFEEEFAEPGADAGHAGEADVIPQMLECGTGFIGGGRHGTMRLARDGT